MTTLFFILIIAVAAGLLGWSLGFKEGNKQATDDIERILDKAITAGKLTGEIE